MDYIVDYLLKNKGVKFAHRGLHSNKVQENTMYAFKRAVDNDLHIETDLRITLDNKIVCHHDSKCNNIPIREWHSRSLKEIFGICFFEDVIKNFPNTYFCVDIKDNEEIAALETIRIISENNMNWNVLICSFHEKINAFLLGHKIANDYYGKETINIGFSVSDVKRFFLFGTSYYNKNFYNADVIVAPHWLVTKRFIKNAEKIGKPIIIYTVNFLKENKNVNGFIGEHK